VETDHPEKAKLTLTVIANVVVENDLETKNIRFSGAQIGKESVMKIPFLAKDQKALSFGKVTSSKDGFTAAMVRDEQKDGAWSLEVKLTPAAAGHVTAKIDVQMLAPEKKNFVVFASAKVEGDIRVVPDVVTMHRKPGASVPARQVRLRANHGTMFKVEKVETSSDDIEVQLTEVTAGENYILTVNLAEKALDKPAFNTSFKVHTNSELQPVIEIPVRVKIIQPQDIAALNK
jgi:hypothetical protein